MAPSQRAPITHPQTGKPLPQRDQPGYYPGFRTLSQQKYWEKATRDLVLERVQRGPQLSFFTADEALTMQAVVDRILPQDDRTPEYRIAILPAIDDRLHSNRLEGYRYADMPPDQEAYSLAAKAFDEMAVAQHGQRFHELGVREQEMLLKSLHDGEPSAAKELWACMNVNRFWSLLVSDCCAAYYAHPWAWDEVGFGGPAYPRGYMRLEEGEAEPWEVEEKRYEWAAPADTISNNEEPPSSGGEHQTHSGQAGTH